MKKYNASVVEKYIQGLDIDLVDTNGLRLEELENDTGFMIDVMFCSRDKKMYTYASDKVKSDLRFVRALLNIFKDDLSFIDCIITDFVDNRSSDDVSKVDLLILASEIFPKDDDRYLKYMLKLEVIQTLESLGISNGIDNTDEETRESLGKGFICLQQKYMESPKAIEFFAKRMILDIIDETGKKFEDILHEIYITKERIKSVSPYVIMVNFLSPYDYNLADYISIHPHVVDEEVKYINKYIKRWDDYNARTERDRYEEVYDKVLHYIARNNYFCYDPKAVLYQIGEELGIKSKLEKYVPSWLKEAWSDCTDDGIPIVQERLDLQNMDFADFVFYSDIKITIMRILGIHSLGLKNMDTRKKAKIIKFAPKNEA